MSKRLCVVLSCCWVELLPAGKQGNLLDWDNDSLIRETKLYAQGRQHGELIIFPIGRQMSAVFWIGEPQQAWRLFVKTRATSMYVLLFLLPLSWAHHMVWAIPLVTGSHLSWLFPFPASCSPPAYRPEASTGNRGNRVAHEAKHCSSKHWYAISAIWSSKLKHIPIRLLWRNLTPSHPDSVQWWHS